MNINDKIAKLLSSKSIEDNIIGIEYLMHHTDFKKSLKRMRIHDSIYFPHNICLRPTFPLIAVGQSVFQFYNSHTLFRRIRTLQDSINAREHVIRYEE